LGRKGGGRPARGEKTNRWTQKKSPGKKKRGFQKSTIGKSRRGINSSRSADKGGKLVLKKGWPPLGTSSNITEKKKANLKWA